MANYLHRRWTRNITKQFHPFIPQVKLGWDVLGRAQAAGKRNLKSFLKILKSRKLYFSVLVGQQFRVTYFRPSRMGNVHRLGNVISDLAGDGNVMGPFFPTCEEFKFLKISVGFFKDFKYFYSSYGVCQLFIEIIV